MVLLRRFTPQYFLRKSLLSGLPTPGNLLPGLFFNYLLADSLTHTFVFRPKKIIDQRELAAAVSFSIGIYMVLLCDDDGGGFHGV